MKCFKITTQTLRAYGGFQYTLGVWTPKLDGEMPLCTSSWYHVYDHPLLAAMFSAIHGRAATPKLFEATYDGRLKTKDANGLMRGVVRVRLDKVVSLPVFSPEQRVRFAIYAARAVYHGSEWITWSNHWLGGLDRSEKAAHAARRSVKGEDSYSGRAAKGAAHAAEYADGTEPAPLSARGVERWEEWLKMGVRESAGAAKMAGFSRSTKAHPPLPPRTSSYWVKLIEKAIIDEDKLQKGPAPCCATN